MSRGMSLDDNNSRQRKHFACLCRRSAILRAADTMKSAPPLWVVNSVRTTDLAFSQYRNAPLDGDME